MSRGSLRARWWQRPGRGAVIVALLLSAVGAGPPAGATAAAPAAVGAAPVADAGTPVVAELEGGDTVLLARRFGNLVRRVHHAADDSWSPWESTSGAAASDPATARELNKRLSVVATRAGGHLWWQRQKADNTWSDWIDLGRPTGTTAVGSPVLVTNDNTYGNRASGNGGIFAGNTSGVISGIVAGSIAGNSDGRLEVFVRGADGRLWHRMQMSPNGSDWSSWEALPGSWSGGFTAITGPDGRITVAARRDDGSVRVTTQKKPSKSDSPLPADNWPSWKEVGTGFNAGLALAATNHGGTALLQLFGNKSNNTLWTVAQTSPRTDQNPNGEWGTGTKLGPAVTGRPAVATHSDGRLAVFGTDSLGYITYRTQTSSATEDSSNGTWNGVWATLGDRTVRSFTLRPASGPGNDGFGVFALDKDTDTLYHRTRLALGSANGDRSDVWMDWNSLSAAGDGPCDGPGSVDCVDINSDLGYTMGLVDPNNPDSEINRELPGVPGTARQTWALRRTDAWNGAVEIVNRTWNRCLKRKVNDGWNTVYLELVPCDSPAPHQWLLEPVPAEGTDAASRGLAGYRIRDSADTALCVTALVTSRWWYDATRPAMIPCKSTDSNDHNIWKLERAGTPSPGVLNIALDQVSRKCAKDPSHTVDVCTFVPTQQPAAYRAVGGCVAGRVVYNQSTVMNIYSLSWSQTTGTELTIGGTVGATFEELSLEFNASNTWIQQDNVTDLMTLNVPPGEFGWIETAPVRRETIGYWEFTVNGEKAWTIPGRNLSYAKDGTDAATVENTFRTSPTPPTSKRCA
ncbi:hypothetical protein GCM10027589_04970 [Actinocorallia lasiicapitis]